MIAGAVVVGSSREFISALVVPGLRKAREDRPGQGLELRGPDRAQPPAGGRRVPARRGQPDDAQPGILRAGEEDRRARPGLRHRRGRGHTDPQDQAQHRRTEVRRSHRRPL
ncbi:MAG: hypothetical protein MZV64_43850 [Ignavibacteriales bacterium]|nr:hypothetical protein [Ignavibacteriales bacterium]